ncbi:hypothetical protein GGI04_004397 [Coemansia thaxteri]|nr:hypothetical protein GGI04_004397 [Coemansia thaxteri]KAJ2469655.1 hypothetical protein GGI02_003339 [Coemansia sp. RSA 2322]
MGGTTGDIPKIQLESREDVQFLQEQLRQFVAAAVGSSAALRGAGLSGEQQSEAAALVAGRAEEWAARVWAAAGRSMTVNGLAYAAAMAAGQARVEALDEALKADADALRDEADALLLAVAAKRRAVPGQIQRLVEDAAWRESLAAEQTTGPPEESDVDRPLPYVNDRVNADFGQALELAQRVRADAPHTAASLRRVADAVADAKERAARDRAADDAVTRALANSAAPAPAADTLLLAHKAALHAIQAD